MLKASEQGIESIREYFEWQAPDLEVTFLQKVYSKAVLNTRHDVWDVHITAAAEQLGHDCVVARRPQKQRHCAVH